MAEVSVLTIDGPGGSGKGTIALQIAGSLGWRYLDSGAIYRVLAWSARQNSIDLRATKQLVDLATSLRLEFKQGAVLVNGVDIDAQIRTESVARDASEIAVANEIRQALLHWQRGYARPPGLVAEGRDMGTVVFPQAKCKIFLTASAQERAERRFKQLSGKGIDVNIDQLRAAISDRDLRDSQRSVAPLRPAADAVVLNSTNLGIDQVVARVRQLASELFEL